MKIAFRTIQPIGNKPKAAPYSAAAVASSAGIPKTSTATSHAEASPRSAAMWARTWKKASSPSNTTTGSAATSAETHTEPSGAYVWGQVIGRRGYYANADSDTLGGSGGVRGHGRRRLHDQDRRRQPAGTDEAGGRRGLLQAGPGQARQPGAAPRLVQLGAALGDPRQGPQEGRAGEEAEEGSHADARAPARPAAAAGRAAREPRRAATGYERGLRRRAEAVRARRGRRSRGRRRVLRLPGDAAAGGARRDAHP